MNTDYIMINVSSYCCLRQQPTDLSSTYDTGTSIPRHTEVFHNLWKNLWKTLIQDAVTFDTS